MEIGRLHIFTIGHSNHSLETFVDLLQQNGIEVLVDTRSQPYSKYASHFNKEALKLALPKVGIKYAFFGKELGGRPDGEAFYDEEGHVLYGNVAEAPFFLEGIERLEKGAAKYRVAIFCSEENPSVCHRRLLVTRVLQQRGDSVCHIRGDGRLQTEEELQAEDAARDGGQQSLFETEEVVVWRSILSVLPKKQPLSSLES